MKICMIWGGICEGSVETSLLCFCMRWGTCADPGIFVPENSSDNFFSPQLYRGCPMVISNKTIYVYIYIYIFFFFGGGGGGGGGPNANIYRNPYSL